MAGNEATIVCMSEEKDSYNHLKHRDDAFQSIHFVVAKVKADFIYKVGGGDAGDLDSRADGDYYYSSPVTDAAFC